MSGEWITLGEEALLEPGSSRCFLVRNRRIAVFRTTSGYHACDDACTHSGAPLSDGWLEEGCVVCPWHGARFSLRSGEAQSPPAETPVGIYEVKAEGGKVLLFWKDGGGEEG